MQQWGAMVQRLYRDGVPTTVREGVRSEQTRFAALQQQGRSVPVVRSPKEFDRGVDGGCRLIAEIGQ